MIKYEDLKNIPVEDQADPLLRVSDALPSVIAKHAQNDMCAYTGNNIYLRQGCIIRLKEALNLLNKINPNASFLITYGYRHPDVQEIYFNDQLTNAQSRYPDLLGDELLEEVHKFIAVPSVAGHPTGGAIDLTIIENNILWDMGTGIADFELPNKIPTFSPEITKKQLCNRLLLRSIMMKSGFAPFDGEWWHFSYGDKEWACYYKNDHAIYRQIHLQNTN